MCPKEPALTGDRVTVPCGQPWGTLPAALSLCAGYLTLITLSRWLPVSTFLLNPVGAQPLEASGSMPE